jgi:dolichyl-phosphate beta-glucosyltransferase
MNSAAAAANPIDLSIVIPVFNESRKIEGDIRAAAGFCSRHGFGGEILVADDCSSDGTADIAERVCPPDGVDLQVLRLSPHRGKGYAVRQGMIRSRGRLALFIDSGGCIPWDEVVNGLALIEQGTCEIAHASRRLAASAIMRPQTTMRRMSAWLFRHAFARLLCLPAGLTDTQTGLKIYRGDAGRALYQACGADGYLFDAEIILRAERAGYRIREFPVTWTSDPDSRLRLRCMPFVLIRDALDLKNRLRREHNN